VLDERVTFTLFLNLLPVLPIVLWKLRLLAATNNNTGIERPFVQFAGFAVNFQYLAIRCRPSQQAAIKTLLRHCDALLEQSE
jgi:hypothetical protein